MMIDKSRSAGPDEGLIIDTQEKELLLSEFPPIGPYLRKIYGGEEFINNTVRWCLWLVDAPTSLMRSSRLIRDRLDKVKRFRLSSNRAATQKLASTPYLFGENRQPTTEYILVPKVSSETRQYMPLGFLPPDVIASGSALVIPDASRFHFGILSSIMHMSWMRQVGGRLESRYQYSVRLVYNNFPWPESTTGEQQARVTDCAQKLLDTRSGFTEKGATLADLYDPLTMPAPLLKAHQALDRAVDRCYRAAPFNSERERVEYLFQLYEQLTAPLASAETKKRRRSKD